MKKLLFLFVSAALLVALSYCGGKKPDVKKGAEAANTVADVTDRGFDSAALKVKGLNAQLSRVSLGGFPSWGAKVPTEKYELWAKLSAPAVNSVAKELPDGYVLQVTGHASKRGSKSRNVSVSKKRAKFVWSALKKQGIDTNKVTYKGVGYSEPVNADDPENDENRRVSFKVVKK